MQVVLLAIRALITCMDITPRAAASLVEGGALRPMCRRLLEIEDMDVAEACLKCIHLLSKVSSYPVCYGDFFSFLFFFFSIPFIIFALCFFLSLLVVTQSRGHIAGSFPPLPTTVRALHFYREKISALSSLVDSRRIVLTYARRSHQLILFFYFCK